MKREEHDRVKSHWLREQTRRHFFQQCGVGVGAMALNSLLRADDGAERGVNSIVERGAQRKLPRGPHFKPQAKAVIFLFMAGGPTQLDLFTDKPKLREHHGQPPPASFLAGKRFAFLKGTETLLGSPRSFQRYGQCGQELSDLIPHHQRIVDDVCWLHGMTTDVFNHGPAKLFVNTGSPQPGRPSMGSWVTYGLGSESKIKRRTTTANVHELQRLDALGMIARQTAAIDQDDA